MLRGEVRQFSVWLVMKRVCNRCRLEKNALKDMTSDFSWKKRYRKDGSYLVQYDGKCKLCRQENDRARRIKTTTQKKLAHTGPTGVDNVFFCQVRPT